MNNNCLNIEPARAESVETLNFEQFVDRYYSMIYRIALGLVCNEADACDLVEKTFSQWASARHLCNGETKVKAWLSATLCHQFIYNHQRETRWLAQEIPREPEAPRVAGAETIERVEPGQVMECLQSMRETLRLPLLLFYVQGHSCKEIADILAVPVGTVISYLSMGKRTLRIALLLRGKQTACDALKNAFRLKEDIPEENPRSAPLEQRSGRNNLGIHDPITFSQ